MTSFERMDSMLASGTWKNLRDVRHVFELRNAKYSCLRLGRRRKRYAIRSHPPESLFSGPIVLDSAEASFVAEGELLGMRDKSIPRTIFVASGQPKDLWKRLVSCFTCCKTRNEHYFVDRAVLPVNTKRNYVFPWTPDLAVIVLILLA
jgi:hypothetical protein